jgi:taurine dioxygenase
MHKGMTPAYTDGELIRPLPIDHETSTAMSLAEATEPRRKASRAKAGPNGKSPKASVRKAKLDIHPASHVLGVEIRGIDLREKQSAETIAALRDALTKHTLLLFRDQDITPEQHVAFSRRFGKLEHHVLAEYLLPGIPEIYVLSNIKKRGKTIGRAGVGEYWHSDLQYLAKPSLGSIMHAIEVPEVGGDTMFANQIAAHEALSDGMKKLLDGLQVVNHFAKARYLSSSGGYARPFSDEELKKTTPVTHPAVRTHPETGEKALYVSPAFALNFVGMTEAESRPILEFIYENSINPRFIYRHKWRAHDIVFWDNRSLMHYAVQDYDRDNDRRHMQRTTITGDKPF